MLQFPAALYENVDRSGANTQLDANFTATYDFFDWSLVSTMPQAAASAPPQKPHGCSGVTAAGVWRIWYPMWSLIMPPAIWLLQILHFCVALGLLPRFVGFTLLLFFCCDVPVSTTNRASESFEQYGTDVYDAEGNAPAALEADRKLSSIDAITLSPSMDVECVPLLAGTAQSWVDRHYLCC